jgi:hypothetical protein
VAWVARRFSEALRDFNSGQGAPVLDNLHCWHRMDDGGVCGKAAWGLDLRRGILVCQEHMPAAAVGGEGVIVE